MRCFITIVFSLACAYSSCLYAQSESGKSEGLRLGVKFSAERAGWRGLSPKRFPVYNGGFQLVRQLQNSDWSLETGLYLTTKVTETATEPQRLRYLNMPLNLRWDKNSFYLAGGAFADYLLFINSGQAYNAPLDPKRAPGFGINGAAGYERHFYKNTNIFFELRYYRSFFDSPRYGTGFISYGIAVGLNLQQRS